MREMIEMCDNWLRVERIELTVFVDNAPAIKVYKNSALKLKVLARSMLCEMVNISMRIIWRG